MDRGEEGVVRAVLGVGELVAGVVPARRATGIEPVRALEKE